MQSGEKLRVAFIIALWIGALLIMAAWPARAETGLNASDLVEIAIESNPQIHSMHAQWLAAQHQILQNYAPADPVFTYGSLDSSRHFNAGAHTHNITESFQFPGEAFLQADESRRTAEIARLTYEAAVRDLRAAVETAYPACLRLNSRRRATSRSSSMSARPFTSTATTPRARPSARQCGALPGRLHRPV